MIDILIFFLHVVAGLFVFTQKWQTGNVREGFLAVALLALVFTIGWAMTNPLASLIYPQSWTTEWFTRDTLSLVILVIPEYGFFRFFFLRDHDEVSQGSAKLP